MSNNNETVEQVALSDRPLAEQLRIIRDNYSTGSGEFDALDEAADVVECNQREVAELRRCLREAVTEVCNRLEKCGFKEPCVFKTCYVQKWRKALQDKGGAE